MVGAAEISNNATRLIHNFLRRILLLDLSKNVKFCLRVMFLNLFLHI